MVHTVTKNERATAEVMNIDGGARRVSAEDQLKAAIEETRGSLGYRRPYVRAALDLAALLAEDPLLNSDPASAFHAFLLSSKIQSEARWRLTRTMSNHLDGWGSRDMLAGAIREAG